MVSIKQQHILKIFIGTLLQKKQLGSLLSLWKLILKMTVHFLVLNFMCVLLCAWTKSNSLKSFFEVSCGICSACCWFSNRKDMSNKKTMFCLGDRLTLFGISKFVCSWHRREQIKQDKDKKLNIFMYNGMHLHMSLLELLKQIHDHTFWNSVIADL